LRVRTVAGHSGKEQTGVRLLEFEGTMRSDGATGVGVRVDERRQHPRAVERWIQVKASLAQDGQVGSQPGSHHHLVNLDRTPVGVQNVERAVRGAQDFVENKGCQQPDTASLDLVFEAAAECTALRQLVGVAAAIGPCHIPVPGRPENRRAGCLVSKHCEVDECADR
jgi:hypothetical protein